MKEVATHMVSAATSGVVIRVLSFGQLNSDLRVNAVNVTPFPQLHLFMATLLPHLAGVMLSLSPTTPFRPGPACGKNADERSLLDSEASTTFAPGL